MKKIAVFLALVISVCPVVDLVGDVQAGTRPKRPLAASRKALTPVQALLGGILAGIAFEVTRNVADRMITDAYRQKKTVVYNDPSGVKVQARPIRYYQRQLPAEARAADPVPAERIREKDDRVRPEQKTEEIGNPVAVLPEDNTVTSSDQPVEQKAVPAGSVQPDPAVKQSVDQVSVSRDADPEKKMRSGYDPEWASSRDSLLKAYREQDAETSNRMPSETGMEPVVVQTEISPDQPAAKPAATETLPMTVKRNLSEKKLASNSVRAANCSEIEITTFKDGKVVGTELREVCE